MASLSRLTLPVLLDAVTGLLRVAMRSFLLMRRVRMILGLEVLGLVWGTSAIPDHELSPNWQANLHPLSRAAFDPSQAGLPSVLALEIQVPGRI
jgi:hypothetical protein